MASSCMRSMGDAVHETNNKVTQLIEADAMFKKMYKKTVTLKRRVEQSDIGAFYTKDLLDRVHTDVLVIAHCDESVAKRVLHKVVLATLGMVVKSVLNETVEDGNNDLQVIILTDTSKDELEALVRHLYFGECVKISNHLAKALGVADNHGSQQVGLDVEIKKEKVEVEEIEVKVNFFNVKEDDNDDWTVPSNDQHWEEDLPPEKSAKEDTFSSSIRKLFNQPRKNKKCPPKKATKRKSLEDSSRMTSLTPHLLQEPDKFRFFHRGVGRSSQIFIKKGESEEDFKKRKSMFTRFPGLIVDGELTKMVACVGCGLIGLNASPGHVKVCPDNADQLKRKEVEIVKDFKHRFSKHINQHFKQVQVDKISCNQCGELFVEMDPFTDHLRDVHFVETNARKLKNTFGSFQCADCGKKFVKLNILQQHEINAHAKLELAQHQCGECGACFTTKGKHDYHYRMKHSEERPYVCDQCAKAFKQRKHLDSHRSIHTGERAWPCRHCDKSFAKDWTRTQHERLHLGIRPYKCDDCPAAFSQQTSLDSHVKTHHGENKKKKIENFLPALST